jgi:RNA polymerase sigma-70 factor, ECF subfamily
METQMADALTICIEPRLEGAEEDRALVSAARSDPEAAGRLFDKYYPEVLRYIYHSTLDHTVTEDLTSNVFFHAFRRLGLFRWRGIPFRAWLYRIATNEIRMHYRRQKRALAFGGGPAALEHATDAASTETTAPGLDEYRLLHAALLQLKPKYRTVIVLRYFEDKSLSEICQITNNRLGTVKSQLHRGLNQLKAALAQAGVALP